MKKYTEQQKIFLMLEQESELDFLPPEQEATAEEIEIEKILATDKKQQQYEQQARRAGVL